MKYSFVVRGAYILFAPAGDPSSQSSDTLMSRQRIYTPLCVSVFGVRFGPVGVAVDVRWFSTCAPCLANWGGGGCRLLVCCVVVECFVSRHTKARHRHTTAAGNHLEKSLLQDRPNPRHKLTEILHILTLLQQANAKTSRNLSIILKRQIKRATIHRLKRHRIITHTVSM